MLDWYRKVRQVCFEPRFINELLVVSSFLGVTVNC